LTGPLRVRLDDLLRSPRDLARLRDLLSGGGVAAIPTETFYGLAAAPTDERGVARIFEIKGRDDGKPLPVLAASREQLVRLGVAARPELLDRFCLLWPAPLTVVLPLAAPIPASRGASTLAVRIPALPPLRDLLETVGPLTGTSANRSGASPLADPAAVAAALGADIDLLVDGGVTAGVLPSTLLDATKDPPFVIRSGAFSWPPREPGTP
jgi:L-threonylcarbamoyladenylate synthase